MEHTTSTPPAPREEMEQQKAWTLLSTCLVREKTVLCTAPRRRAEPDLQQGHTKKKCSAPRLLFLFFFPSILMLPRFAFHYGKFIRACVQVCVIFLVS